jgi:ubiquinone/menaquinone biosynthesis C-methylase UbiE
MPMTQDDIRRHYETDWAARRQQAGDGTVVEYCDPVQEAVDHAVLDNLIGEMHIKVDGGRVLDIGSGSGRFIRFFLDRFAPAHLTGFDFTEASVELLRSTFGPVSNTPCEFIRGDITDPDLDLPGGYDVINIGHVLFHIPENDKYIRALHNLAKLVAKDGHIITTEYLPRTSMRTQWMQVRSRYEFDAALKAVGLRTVQVRSSSFFSSDPMGIDGLDDGTRGLFNTVKANMLQIRQTPMNDASRQFFTQYMVNIELAALAYLHERVAEVDHPSKKFVVIARA